jgi:hypothetical protein
MSTQLRDMFDAVAESEVPNGFAERAIGAARQRRRQRYVVGAAVLATAAVVLGVVVAVSDVRMDAEPRPTDVAAIPEELPSWRSLPNLVPGAMESAGAGYIVDGQLVLVDAETGEAMHAAIGPPPDSEAAGEVLISVSDVAISPDGERAVITVAPWPGDVLPSIRILHVAAALDTEVPGLTPADDAGGVTVARPSVYAWADSSETFECACASRDLGSGRSVPQLYEVNVSGGEPAVELSPNATDLISPVQVVTGSIGTFMRAGDVDDWWPSASNPSSVTLDGYAVAFSRGNDQGYLEMRVSAELRASELVLGNAASGDSFIAPLAVQAVIENQYVVVTDVEAVVGGFVAVIAVAERGEQFQAPADAIRRLEAVFIRPDGAQQDLTTFPNGTSTASFASDLLEIAEPEVKSTLPAELPNTAGLPTLLSGDSITASAAYAVDGHLVVIDAATGDGYLVDLAVGNDMEQAPVGGGAEVHLSPDGQYVLLTRGQGAESAQAEDVLWLVDLHRGLARKQDYGVVASEELGSTPPSRIAWAPDGQQFAVLAANSFGAPDMVQRFELDEMDEHLNLGGGPIVAVASPTQIVWGHMGLLGQFDELDGDWAWFDAQGGVSDLKEADPRELEPLQMTSRMAADRILLSPHSKAYVEWSDIGLIEAFQGDTALTLQVGQRWFTGSWVDDGPIVVLQDRALEANERREVSFFVTDGTGGSVAGLFPISTLPPGTVAASFAADLVGAQQVNG